MRINQKQKVFIKAYIVMLILIFILANWSDVSWVFNYRVVYGLVYDFFNPYPNSVLFANNDEIFFSNKNTSGEDLVEKETYYSYSDKSNSIEIKSISITAPLVIGLSTELSLLEKSLNQGVVLYPESVLPGEKGQTVVLGHSAPPNWPRIKYDWVFSGINDLNLGDHVVVHFNNKRYVYRISQKNILDKGQEITNSIFDGNNNVLVMISCWPPGKNYKRVAVQAELVKKFDKL